MRRNVATQRIENQKSRGQEPHIKKWMMSKSLLPSNNSKMKITSLTTINTSKRESRLRSKKRKRRRIKIRIDRRERRGRSKRKTESSEVSPMIKMLMRVSPKKMKTPIRMQLIPKKDQTHFLAIKNL